jgi:hypothetical protein
MVAAMPMVASCGDIGEGNNPTAEGETEGVYITTGGLRYQVQMSRKLNPYDVEDQAYLVGIPDPAAQVANKRFTWFGVFIRVENRTGHAGVPPKFILSANNFRLEDNEGEISLPVPHIPVENVFAYRPRVIPPRGVTPKPSSIAAQSPIGGALILFKVDQNLLERRPVLLKIKPPTGGEEAEVRLDI